MNANCFVSLRRHNSHTWVNSLDNILSIVIIFFFIFSINNSAKRNYHLHSSSSRRQVQGIPLGTHIRIMPHYDLHSIPDTNNLFFSFMKYAATTALFLIATTNVRLPYFKENSCNKIDIFFHFWLQNIYPWFHDKM